MDEYSLECEINDISAEQAIIIADAIRDVVKRHGLDVEIHILNKENKNVKSS